VDTQTFTICLYWGGVSGTPLLNFGAQNPNSSGTETGAAWLADSDTVANSATALTVTGWDGLAYFFNAETETGGVTVANTSSEQFVIGVTPSATAASITCNGFFCERRAWPYD